MRTIIIFNTNQILHQTNKAYLIEAPLFSDLSGFNFWIPKSLCNIIDDTINIYIPESFLLRIHKNRYSRAGYLQSESYNLQIDEIRCIFAKWLKQDDMASNQYDFRVI